MINLPTLSDQWRSSSSTRPALELALVLQSLERVIGMVSTKKMSVCYNSVDESSTSDKMIRIDPTYARRGGYPVPPENMDILVGLSLHEASHVLCESLNIHDRMVKNIKNIVAKGFNQARLDQLLSVANSIYRIGEEIYVDDQIKKLNETMYAYVYRARLAYRHHMEGDPLLWTNALHAWIGTALYGLIPPQDVDLAMLLLYKDLGDLTNILRQGGIPYPKRALHYAEYALKYYNLMESQSIQKRLSGQVGNPQPKDTDPKDDGQHPDDTDPTGQPVPGDPEDDNDEDDSENGDSPTTPPDDDSGGITPQATATSLTETPSDATLDHMLPGHSDTHMDPDLYKAITASIEHQEEDITSLINGLIQDEVDQGYKVKISRGWKHRNDDAELTTVWIQATTQIEDKFDQDMAKDLNWILQMKNRALTRTTRGHARGHIDPTRLYRVGYSDQIFQQGRTRPQQEWDLILLLDASISMRDCREVYSAAYTIHHVVPESRVLSYSLQDDLYQVTIDELASPNKPNKQVSIGGSTPSGSALLTTVQRYPRSLVVHFTDGECNAGISMDSSLEIIERRYKEAYVVSVEYPDAKTTSVTTNSKVIPLDDLSNFSSLLMDAFNTWNSHRSGY